MRNGFLLILGALALVAPGCAAMRATTETAKVAGKTTVTVVKATTKAVTWPVREAMTARKRKSQATEDVPAMVVSHTSSTREKPKQVVDGDVVLAGATEDDREALPEDADEAPAPRRPRKRHASKRSEEVKLADVDDETDMDTEPETELETPKKKAGWKSRASPGRTASYDSDPDTIRIE
ncbi:hypothetical protein EP7_000323 [Isosphaeraceae bacterium EP7]